MDPQQAALLVEPDRVAAALSEALAAIAAAATPPDLAATRQLHDGDRSPLALANRALGSLPPSERAAAGARIGAARTSIREALLAREGLLHQQWQAATLRAERVDVTEALTRSEQQRPRVGRGGRHPLSTIAERVAEVFTALGYEVAEGPEVEAEWFTFDALNIPADHPARSMQDTFFVTSGESGVVLRTQTSPIQIRALLARPLPVYVIAPGRVYRTDELDATHTPVFHQVEGLAVDRGITMADLKGTLDHLAQAMFGSGLVTRLRPSYFPFTEPSAEVDLQCFACRGACLTDASVACRTCGNEGWIEWGGCGMVNPRVLRGVGIDTDTYSGFAFGMGLERTLMNRHRIVDMRALVEGDIRFTRQFGSAL
ncbi:MAG: phenylalanine--tRNA ligase subunit alpha [Actinomycetales bacterium]|nr:phenylalanine--tRNA ligase subunit alpha [Actinomycetales bacterium]